MVIPIPLTNTLPNPDQNTSQPTHTSVSSIQDPSEPPLVPSPNQPGLFPFVTLRRSTRHTKPPLYLSDYITPKSKTVYLIQRHCSLLALSSPYRALINKISAVYEPKFYHQAAPYPEWRQVMNDEIKALEANSTWTLVPLPPDKHCISCRWVYKVKYKMDGSVDRYKARLVAKGYTEQAGIDFSDTFFSSGQAYHCESFALCCYC